MGPQDSSSVPSRTRNIISLFPVHYLVLSDGGHSANTVNFRPRVVRWLYRRNY